MQFQNPLIDTHKVQSVLKIILICFRDDLTLLFSLLSISSHKLIAILMSNSVYLPFFLSNEYRGLKEIYKTKLKSVPNRNKKNILLREGGGSTRFLKNLRGNQYFVPKICGKRLILGVYAQKF